MNRKQDKTGGKPDGRYEKLLKGEITSGQYVESLKRDAGSQRSSRTGRYLPARSGKRSATA